LPSSGTEPRPQVTCAENLVKVGRVFKMREQTDRQTDRRTDKLITILCSLLAKESAGLALKDGKRPDGCTAAPWLGGKRLAWDVTVCTTVADSYVTTSSQSAGSVAEQAADRKC